MFRRSMEVEMKAEDLGVFGFGSVGFGVDIMVSYFHIFMFGLYKLVCLQPGIAR